MVLPRERHQVKLQFLRSLTGHGNPGGWLRTVRLEGFGSDHPISCFVARDKDARGCAVGDDPPDREIRDGLYQPASQPTNDGHRSPTKTAPWLVWPRLCVRPEADLTVYKGTPDAVRRPRSSSYIPLYRYHHKAELTHSAIPVHQHQPCLTYLLCR